MKTVCFFYVPYVNYKINIIANCIKATSLCLKNFSSQSLYRVKCIRAQETKESFDVV